MDFDFTQPIRINLRTANKKNLPALFDFQKTAVDKLKKCFLTDDKPAGFLQMPTGSGKTLTSVYFLLTEMAARGYQIIWIAHRHMLIDQAASVFCNFAPTLLNQNIFRAICLSSKHCWAGLMTPQEDLIVGSVQTLARSGLNYLTQKNKLKSKVIIVVDEAHHTLAPSYQKIIDAVRKQRPDTKLLGLTATPVRINDSDTAKLGQIYDNNIIHSVPMSRLISDGTLSRPLPTQVYTDIDIESQFDAAELAEIIRSHGDIPDKYLDKIAGIARRNEIIVRQYQKERWAYGKTLIFAININHCRALNEQLQRRGVKSGCVFSGNPSNDSVIDKFKRGGLDVLVNVNILTEGIDIPKIETVFLTRPTSSDVLLMQMVGRGMRGKNAGGTEICNIVDFCDKWASITRWLNPKIFFAPNAIEDEKEIPIPPPIPVEDPIPWDLIRAVIGTLSIKIEGEIPANTVLPRGWYSILDAADEEEYILVFENQLLGYKNLRDDLERGDFRDSGDLIGKYFSGFGFSPTENELRDLVAYFKSSGFPELQEFPARDDIDPFEVAKYLKDFCGDDLREIKSEITRIYNDHQETIDKLYGNFREYRRRVNDFLDDLIYGDSDLPNGARVEFEYSYSAANPFREPLENLLRDVIDDYQNILGEDFSAPKISWTDRAYKVFLAQFDESNNWIKINRLLNSQDIPRDFIEFVIYCECLQKLAISDKQRRQFESEFEDFQYHKNFCQQNFPNFKW